jgi:hypothetical protein
MQRIHTADTYCLLRPEFLRHKCGCNGGWIVRQRLCRTQVAGSLPRSPLCARRSCSKSCRSCSYTHTSCLVFQPRPRQANQWHLCRGSATSKSVCTALSCRRHTVLCYSRQLSSGWNSSCAAAHSCFRFFFVCVESCDGALDHVKIVRLLMMSSEGM